MSLRFAARARRAPLRARPADTVRAQFRRARSTFGAPVGRTHTVVTPRLPARGAVVLGSIAAPCLSALYLGRYVYCEGETETPPGDDSGILATAEDIVSSAEDAVLGAADSVAYGAGFIGDSVGQGFTKIGETGDQALESLESSLIVVETQIAEGLSGIGAAAEYAESTLLPDPESAVEDAATEVSEGIIEQVIYVKSQVQYEYLMAGSGAVGLVSALPAVRSKKGGPLRIFHKIRVLIRNPLLCMGLSMCLVYPERVYAWTKDISVNDVKDLFVTAEKGAEDVSNFVRKQISN